MKKLCVLIFSAFLCVAALPITAESAVSYNPPHIVSWPTSCNNCHIQSPHHSYASYPAQLNNLCESCHFPGGPATEVMTHSSRTTDNGYGNWDLDCWSCHEPHSQEQNFYWGSTYGKYIRRDLNAEIKEIDPNDPGPYYWPLSIIRTEVSANIRFTGPTEFVDGDAEANDDICQVCHVNTHYYNKLTALNTHADTGADTQPGGVCTTCHKHEDGFMASGCTNCHSSAQPSIGQYRRQVTGTGGDFGRTSHHVDDGLGNEIVQDSDCNVCHDQSNHQGNADPSVLLNDGDGGTGHTYDGTGGSLEAFCLSCHDADGYTAAAGKPFTSNLSPLNIATSWVGSPHDTSLTSEACMSCHGGTDTTRTGLAYDNNAHGSSSNYILSTTVAGETVSGSIEGICFACHDGAPAVSNIEAEFSGGGTMTSANGSLLNPHHDVTSNDEAYSGARMSCSDCHDPHAASLVSDPDPGDGSTPTAGASWSGSSWLSEFCLDCHDNTFPASITPPVNPLVNIKTVFPDTRGDQHGANIASKNVSLRAGSGYARGDILDCDVCHNLGHGDTVNGTAYPNLSNLRSIIYAADGVTELTPDFTSVPGTNIVRITDVSSTDATLNGRAWCSTCHPNPMGGNKTTGCLAGSCHNHGTGSF